MVQIRDFAGSKDAQSHTHRYYSHQQLHCLLSEVSQMHDFPQIGYVKRNVDEKEKCESVVWFPPRILCATLYYYPPSFCCTVKQHLFTPLSYFVHCLIVCLFWYPMCYVTRVWLNVRNRVRAAIPSTHPSAAPLEPSQSELRLSASLSSLSSFLFQGKEACWRVTCRSCFSNHCSKKIKLAEHVTLEINLERVSVVSGKAGTKREQPCMACEARFWLTDTFYPVFACLKKTALTIKRVHLEGIATLSLFSARCLLQCFRYVSDAL